MKRPLTPFHSPGSGICGSLAENSCIGSPPEQRSKREKKHPSFTLCEVCNIQLNSAVQAQIHFNGKSHQKRLKHLNKGKVLSSAGPANHNNSLLASLPIPGRSLHPSLDIKHFLTFRLNGTPPLNLFPNFNTMDPVQKAVINHTFGVPNPLKKKQFISCNICHLRFNSANQAEAHYRGHKHARRLKAIEAVKNKHKTADNSSSSQEKMANFEAALDISRDTTTNSSRAQPSSLLGLSQPMAEHCNLMLMSPTEESPAKIPTGVLSLVSPSVSEPLEVASDSASVRPAAAAGMEVPATESGGTAGSAAEVEKEGKKIKQHLYCPTCKVTVNSASQLEAHNSGAKHKLMLEGQTVLPRRSRGKVLSRAGHKPKRIGSKGSLNIQNKAFQCQVCEIFVNSETQLKQHMSSRRHKDRLAGKPPKPKYSPYSKLQKNTALAVSILKSKVALQKHLTKTLAARFLPSPLAPATVCTLPSPLTLRPAAATLFQAPIFGPALFRSPPGPVRAATGPIVFAPY
ncbi:PREDICTED: zinc finger protein 385C isoform X1 [Thamnophis sirtalis]|uniref:Zinc finger protein 385C isoform X1 n=1 Tax=Thamnophis sirtalis TaxID=35019 RepID=A0A6I9X2W8_9SAUR|nr:PREDICTED: zinc finger protein 385C isoform X1 [Thamnophis sirtalis]XP_013908182.1 PREDICTED: zinc finger protein 385C isoform X1 [Thamnophis sirtalis]XP_032093293.1 zinc finger protein 385C [Thamnophis elegans]